MNTLPWLNPARAEALQRLLRERILVIDGAMGTMIQQHELDEADYRGERFAEGFDQPARPRRPCPRRRLRLRARPARQQRPADPDPAGDHPATSTREYLDAGADLVETNTFNSTTVSLADYGLEHLARELNETGARLARAACDAAEAKRPGPAALRHRRARPDQPHRLAEPGRQPPRLPRDQLRRAARAPTARPPTA